MKKIPVLKMSPSLKLSFTLCQILLSHSAAVPLFTALASPLTPTGNVMQLKSVVPTRSAHKFFYKFSKLFILGHKKRTTHWHIFTSFCLNPFNSACPHHFILASIIVCDPFFSKALTILSCFYSHGLNCGSK
jgi:hypothetical protein